ncbi:MAG TPA: GAF domain-containing protein [Armatimonadota bacterium]|jgi:two-component sensor histidine kinase/putative methionine-R-sulfoxide reductase with GAF domain
MGIQEQPIQSGEPEELRRRIECLEQQLRVKTLEADALHRVSEAIAGAETMDQMLQVVAEVAVSVTGTEACFIYLLDRSRGDLVMRAIYGGDPSVVGKIRLRNDEGVTGWVATHKTPLAISEFAWKDPRFKSFPELTEERFHSFLSMPIVAKDHTLGVINVRTMVPHQYTDAQVHLLDTIAGQVAGSIELAWLHHASEARGTQLDALSEISKTLTSNLYLEEILQLIVAMMAERMSFRICSIMLLDEKRGELQIHATSSESPEYLHKPNLKIDESIAGQAVLLRRPVVVEDVRSAPGYRYTDLARREGLCSLIAVPLLLKDKVIGVINCYTSKPHNFTEDEIRLLTTLGNQAAIAIENSELMVKSAIIQEMHHRIKNNLQTIASLLRLQMHHKTASLDDILKESINRILSIAAVHDLLSRGDLDAVSFHQMAESILTATKQNFLSPNKQMISVVEGDDVLLPSSQATSMALILNELIANAVEHGFHSVSEASLRVRLQRHDGTITVEVRNSGEPLPEGFALNGSNSLGLQIVDSLARETLKGQFALVSEGEYTVARLQFPDHALASLAH